MIFGFYTLGCKQNQYETQAMEQLLLEQGHTIGNFESFCDCYVINTCTVTAVGDKKSRNMVRRVQKLNPAAVIGICGCYSQIRPEEAAALGVQVVAGTGDRKGFLRDMLRAAETGETICGVKDVSRLTEFEVLPAGGLPDRTRAMLKVEDGCDNFCSYCIIPFARGRVRSLPAEKAVAQAQTLAAEGYLEMVITGIEISSWGSDLIGENGLRPMPEDLIALLCAAVPGMRVRLGSLEPRTVTEALCRKLSVFGNLCPQFHLSLQSGSDTVLKRMHRKYTAARYEESIALLRNYFPGCAITTDLIVGFPGESEEEFRESLAFIQRCALAQVHIFPYSRRVGTVAAKMPGQLTKAEKERRSEKACALAEELRTVFLETMLGSEQDVLFEQNDGAFSTGHAMNYMLCYLPEADLHNVVLRVRVTGLYRDGLLCERC